MLTGAKNNQWMQKITSAHPSPAISPDNKSDLMYLAQNAREQLAGNYR
jgi:hypothetical protein